MLNLKSIYFYFLATRINFTKEIKKIYFTTKFYNKTLKSKTPKQFYFYPNSFLLSSFTNHRNFSFKLSEVEPGLFWVEQKINEETKKLNNFLWLNLIDRKNDNILIKKIITVWIYKNPKYKKIIWDNSVISNRIISWILNADIILKNTDNVFKNDFFNSIIIQTNHLKKNIKFENDPSKKIEIISAILLTGLIFKEYSQNFDLTNKELEKLIEYYFDKDGFPIDRNSKSLFKFSKYLIIIKECINDAQEYIPDYLDAIIEKNLVCLKSIQTPVGQAPLFNGVSEFDLKSYFNYIAKLNYKIKKPKEKIGNLQKIKYKKHLVYFDVGAPPKKSHSKNYQSGALSFEYFLGEKKIITNCGYGNKISKKATLLSKLTSAQSTLCINDFSVVNFERNKQINSAFGNSIKSSFQINNFEYEDNLLEIKTSAEHDAYKERFGYIHNREIKIDKKNEILIGSDMLKNINSNKTVKINIRFHLYPGIPAFQTIGGNSVLIQIEKNKSLIFASKGNKISLEKSIFLGKNKILNNLCINITDEVIGNKLIKWELKKSN